MQALVQSGLPRIVSVTVHSPYAALLAVIPVRDATTEVLGSHTRYWDYGPPDSTTTLIVVHGYRGDHHGLEPVVAHLEGIRIISPDLPGFGQSTPLVGHSHDIAGYSAWLVAFVERLGLTGTAVILGHSFGSIVASAAVAGGLATPRLILVNPIAAPALEGPNGVMSRVTLGFYRVGRALPEKLGKALLSNWVVVRFISVFMMKTKDPVLRRFINDQHHTYFSSYANRDTVVEGFEASITADVSMFASKITVPTLLIGADIDPITTVAAQKALETLLPDARLVILSGVGHLVHYERPREAAEQIVEFLGAGRVAS